MRTNRSYMAVVAALILAVTGCSGTGQSPAPSASSPTASTPSASAPTASGELSPEGPSFTFAMIGQQTTLQRPYTLVEEPYFGDGGIVEQRSHGRIKFQLSAMQEMGIAGPDLGRTLESGVVDFSRVGILALGTQVPLATAGDIAGLYPDFGTAREGTDAFLAELSPITEDQIGIKLLGSHPFSGDVLFCNDPLESIADIEGRRVRTTGTSVVDLVAALGATNVTIAFTEVYQALQQGLADCAITDRASGNNQKWWEITHYLYNLPITYSASTYGANLDTWDSLPADIQDFLQGIFDEVTEKQWALAQELAASGVACNLGDASNCPEDLGTPATRPMVLVEPAEGDLARLREIAENSVLPAWLDRCGTSADLRDQCRTVFNETIGDVVGVHL